MVDATSGWEALARGAWEQALLRFAEPGDSPEVFEGIGIAQWWLDDAEATIHARERAYRLYRKRGDVVAAARVASALAWDSVLFGGRTAVARGWLGRSERLLDEQPLCVEHAWLAIREAEVGLSADEPERALAAARRAIRIGSELAVGEVQIVGRSLEGVALVHLGDVSAGMRSLDESAAAATAGDITDLMWIGKVCCNLIAACENVGDVERATQWCDEVKDFARRWELQTLFNTCRTQYAAVLLQRGIWVEAETELTAGLAGFASSRRAVVVEGTARLGELRRRQGRLDEAGALFAQAEPHPLARLGAAELALDEGDAARAYSLAERIVRTAPAGTHGMHVHALNLLVRAAAADGRPQVARDAAARLDQVAQIVGTDGARAAALHANGLAAACVGDLTGARTHLEDAIDRYGRWSSPYERARVRLALARVLIESGDRAGATREVDAAGAAFDALAAANDARTTAALRQRINPRTDGPNPLTPRERQVLALVATGQSNHEIAAHLVVSEHTVHRHVSNILRKLDEPTRAAAAARATRDALI
jgi:ATP/maltotriose-dependent transcriptional regulator MalT